MAEINIKDLIGKAHFDYVGPAFPLWWKTNKTKMILPDLMGISEAILKGKPYFTTLKLRYKGEEFVLPNEPLIALSLSKTIKETPTVGKFRKGTVKEYITTEDYQINLRGVCVDLEDTDRYPAEQVDEINKLFEINDALEVVDNKFFELFGIRNIVFKEKRFEEMAGQQGLQKYSLTAVSDQDFYADLSERDKNLKQLTGN